MSARKARMLHAGSPLPDRPDTGAVEEWLHAVRAEFYARQEVPLGQPA